MKPTAMIPMAQVEFGEQAIAAAVKVLRSGQLVQGAKVKEFEEAFASAVGARHGVAVNSGTAALHVAYLAVLKPGDEVLVPTFSHISTASMVHYSGGTPVFCDISPDTFTISLNDIQNKITGRTKAIAPVHLFGNACPVDEIKAVANQHKLTLIWDACQAHGTRYKGSDVGSMDDMTCYSFYPTKNMTVGEGGIITTNSDDLAERCRLLRAHWQTKKYFHPNLGLNYRMREMEGALGLEQLKLLPKSVRQRRNNAAYLSERLAMAPGISTPIIHGYATSSFHQYSILLDIDLLGPRNNFMTLLQEKGVACAVHYPRPIHKQPAFIDRFGDIKLPVSEDTTKRILSIPVHPGLSNRQRATVADMVLSTAEQQAFRAPPPGGGHVWPALIKLKHPPEPLPAVRYP